MTTKNHVRSYPNEIVPACLTRNVGMIVGTEIRSPGKPQKT